MATVVQPGSAIPEFPSRSWSERHRSLRAYLIGVASGGALIIVLVRVFG